MAPIIGPGLGYHGDRAVFLPKTGFLGIAMQTNDPRQSGQVLGDSTSTARRPSGGSSNKRSGGDKIIDDTSKAHDEYIRSLDEQLKTLPGQQSSLISQAESAYNMGLGDINLQEQQGMQSLEQNRQEVQQNQALSLRDLASNMRNQLQAGNTYLGALGAGDSSAVNQYSYALNKEGTRQRSNVMQNTARILNDIGTRETNLKNIVAKAKNDIMQEKNIKVQQIAQWFMDAQRQIKDAKGRAGKEKGLDIANLSARLLDNATQALNQVNSTIAEKENVLTSWASDNFMALENQKARFSGMDTGINGQPAVDSRGQVAPVGYGSQSSEDNLFSNRSGPMWSNLGVR